MKNSSSNDKKQQFHLRKRPFVIVAFFLALLLVGVVTGEPPQVLSQAVQICLSCIGIG
ncbi:MAG: hypothetical protein KAK02_00220 [Desulfobulbaceae bacterium]|nr:hypothetical protein [Desulfobulbaceae bacterium]